VLKSVNSFSCEGILSYLCLAFEDARRVKAAAQHSSSELGSALALALALHFALSIANDKTRVKNQINPLDLVAYTSTGES